MLAKKWRKGNPLTLVVGMHPGAAALENSMEIPQKVKNRATLQPSNCTTRYLCRRYENTVLRGHMHLVYGSIINNSQIMERAQMSINWWMDKEDMGCIYILLSHQKEWNLAICNDVDGTRGIMLSEISQSEKEIPYDFTLIWNLRNKKMNIREEKEK